MKSYCQYCGKEIEKRKNTKFCNDECRAKSKQKVRYCIRCNKELTGTKFKFYCSDECRTTKHFTNKCKCCGKEIPTRKKFCNTECRNKIHNNKNIERNKVTKEKFRNIEFESIKKLDNDIDFIAKKYFKLSSQRIQFLDMLRKVYKVRIERRNIHTTRGSSFMKVAVISFNEMVDVYEYKIKRFREYPTMQTKQSAQNMFHFIKRLQNDISVN